METKSYEFNGKRYDFVLSLRAKIEIENLQKAGLKNPEIATIGLKVDGLQRRVEAMDKRINTHQKVIDTHKEELDIEREEALLTRMIAERDVVVAELQEKQAAIIPFMDEIQEIDPLQIGYLVLSNYGPYRAEMTRDIFDDLVEDMDTKLGVEETFSFFVDVQDMVFTQLAAMQKMQDAKAESRNFVNQIAK